MNLVEFLQKKNNESRQFLQDLEETKKLLLGSNHAGLEISRTLTQHIIDTAEAAIASGDVLQMISAAKLHGLDEEAQP